MSQLGESSDLITSDSSEDASYNFDMSSVPSIYDASFAHPSAQGLGVIYNSTAYQDLPGAYDEPPLLEELGISPKRILQKSLAVLNPLGATDRQQILQDTDMAGPLVFCLTLGGFLLLRGKVTFSSIYLMGVLGCIFFHCLLSLMVIRTQVTFLAVASVLGYCLLPMVVLSGLNVFITIRGTLGLIATGASIFWCSNSASKMFATAFAMNQQRLLIAYPCAVLYGGFALITIY
ncbi:hypothetical protein KR054_002662 [Drosophila jambulina]|nr:hypothetical protein KR054_002662 [Drosophila jambulina]